MNRHQGFTIVELMVVIVIIGILGTISIVFSNKVQSDARDKKRETDIVVLQTYLEKYYDKNGIYPAGCFNTSKSATSMGSCNSKTLQPGDTAPNWIGYNSTVSDLQAFMPGLPDDFADPSSANKTFPFGNTANPSTNQLAHTRYYYGGSHPSDGTVGTVNGPFGCSNLWDGTLSGTNPSNYFLAYWSESKQQYIFKHGLHGSLYEFKTGTSAPSYCKYTEP